MSSVECWCGFGPGVEAAVDDVGEVSFERSACFAGCFAFGDFAGEVGARLVGGGDLLPAGVDSSGRLFSSFR
jgi:hypothetical protein